jgi:hypothetical protein
VLEQLDVKVKGSREREKKLKQRKRAWEAINEYGTAGENGNVGKGRFEVLGDQEDGENENEWEDEGEEENSGRIEREQDGVVQHLPLDVGEEINRIPLTGSELAQEDEEEL